MRVLLMYPDRDFDPEAALPAHARQVCQDLELPRLLVAMARDDEFLYRVAERALFAGLTDPDTIRYRQGALRDCLDNPDTVIGMYNLVFEALAEERKHWMYKTVAHRPSPDRLIGRSLTLLTTFLDALVRLRDFAEAHRGEFTAPAFLQLFDTLSRELDHTYVDTVRGHLKTLRFAQGVHIAARIEKGGSSTDYTLRAPNPSGWMTRLRQLASSEERLSAFRIPPRDEAGSNALGVLRARGIMEVAESSTRSADHVTAFLRQLRAELGFYIGCLHLYRELRARHAAVAIPTPTGVNRRSFRCRGLYDPCLALSVDNPVAGNDIDADGKTLMVITGANQGGKSTCLRSLGLAQMMMQAGMFVPANTFRANIRADVFTHFEREEDETMTHGKFDEELVRMSALLDSMTADALLLCNESFASTNEREGSAIAEDVIAALTDAGVQICYVTHMYALAADVHARQDRTHLFLRAERLDDGTRTFRIVPAPPLPTSHGDDVYRRIFGTDPERPLAGLSATGRGA